MVGAGDDAVTGNGRKRKGSGLKSALQLMTQVVPSPPAYMD